MQPTHRSILPVLALALALAGCGDNQDPAGADAFWTKIHDEGYASFAHAPGYATRQPTAAPHGDEVVIYVNDTLAAAIGGAAIKEWPMGSLIVKDGYTGGKVTVVAAMEKRKDGWYWGEWHSDGTAKYSGKPDLCTGCHASGADLVRAFGFPK